jgi:hypothetical protein
MHDALVKMSREGRKGEKFHLEDWNDHKYLNCAEPFLCIKKPCSEQENGER